MLFRSAPIPAPMMAPAPEPRSVPCPVLDIVPQPEKIMAPQRRVKTTFFIMFDFLMYGFQKNAVFVLSKNKVPPKKKAAKI